MAVTLLLAGVAAPFFPAEVLFAAALAGLPTTAFFLFGESLFGPRRIIAVCLSLLASAGCLTGAIVLGEQRTAAREHSEFLSELERIEASLNEDRFPEARDRILTFRSRIQRQPGVYVSDAGQHASEKADKLLDAWLHDRFGELSPEGRYLVGVLLTRYSFKTASGARRFPSLSVSKKSIKLTALVEMPAGDRRQAFLQGHAILNLATDTLPDVPKLELQLVGVGPDGQEENLGTLNLPSE